MINFVLRIKKKKNDENKVGGNFKWKHVKFKKVTVFNIVEY